MNKLMKGAVAGAAGIALLLGGAGTFAVWNAEASLQAATIKSGNLALTANTDGVWKDGSTTVNLATYKIIPGKTLTYTQTLDVIADGNDLTATLTNSGVTTSSNTITGLTTSMSVEKVSGSNLTVGGTNGSTIAVTNGGTTAGKIKATVTVTFPSSSTEGKSGTAVITAPTFTLTQTTA
ncbi:alternate-type signal peptide domain-containing protein [Herbiconiux sp. L3-i23]|uniref:alternate-type signal peptide domain-containing protein n=1 Tax=Herbiconiux sp. L3-i23 TaxID=2905871 RepID=UPI00204B4436|nr:alternate-type signal peptide domain-containing protein [Herbiconiux sp. L3-i23]BDI23056.1 hypothetical protein L3i23_18320 [Herbiconiux sp. L3-i23]